MSGFTGVVGGSRLGSAGGSVYQCLVGVCNKFWVFLITSTMFSISRCVFGVVVFFVLLVLARFFGGGVRDECCCC